MLIEYNNDLEDFIEIKVYNSETFDIGAQTGRSITVKADSISGKLPLLYIYGLIGSSTQGGSLEGVLPARIGFCPIVMDDSAKHYCTFYLRNTTTSNFKDLGFSYYVLYINKEIYGEF